MNKRPVVFIDTSVWISGVLSDRGASAVILKMATQKQITVVSSPDVLDEALTNLREKYPLSLEYFLDIFNSVHPILVQPTKADLLRAVKIIHPDDAPILAAAIKFGCEFLITLDKKHFISPPDISKKSGLAILVPGQFLQQSRLSV